MLLLPLLLSAVWHSVSATECAAPVTQALGDSIAMLPPPGATSPGAAAAGAVTRVAYLKTHKTGSTTLGSVLFRYAKRRNVTAVPAGAHLFVTYETPEALALRGEVILQHITGGQMRAGGFGEAVRFYDAAIVGNTLITTVREPAARLVSWYYYFVAPYATALTLDEWLDDDGAAARCTLAAEFGVYDEMGLAVFLHEHVGRFAFMAVADRFDDSVVALALQLGWSVADALYTPLLDSHTTAGATRWDGRALQPTPRLADLPEATVARLRAVAHLDYPIYHHAVRMLDASIARQGARYVAARAAFDGMQTQLATLCGGVCVDRTRAHDAWCEWYALSDLQYEDHLRQARRPPVHLDDATGGGGGGVPRWWALTPADAIVRSVAARLRRAVAVGELPTDTDDADAVTATAAAAVGDDADRAGVEMPPSSVRCVGELSDRTWRKTCVYEHLYFINNTYMYAEVETEAEAESEAEYAHRVAVLSQDRPIQSASAGDPPYVFVPMRVPHGHVMAWMRAAAAVERLRGTNVLFDRFYPAAIGHNVWNDVFSVYTALADAGLPHTTVTPVVLSQRERASPAMDSVMEVFCGGGATRYSGAWAARNQTVHLQRVVVGTGQGGADDVQQLRRLLQGRRGVRRAFWHFRRRMLQRHGMVGAGTEVGAVVPLAEGHRDPHRTLKVVVVYNKRADLHMEAIASMLTGAAGDDNWSVHLLDFQEHNDTDRSQLQSTLEWVHDADVYVSGIGTAIMWAPLARAGAVVVNLAWLSNYGSGPYFYSTHHSLDHMMQDHMRVLYYPPAQRWQGVSLDVVLKLIRQAAALIRGGFPLPVPLVANADVTGAAYLDLCLRNVTTCRLLLAAATGDRRAPTCAGDRYADHYLFGRGCWQRDRNSQLGKWVDVDWDAVDAMRERLRAAGVLQPLQ